MPKRLFTDAQEQQIAKEYLTKLPDGAWPSTPMLASKWGCAAPTINHVLRRQGVALRSQREAHLGKSVKPRTSDPPSEPPPLCKCGRGLPVRWSRKKKRWLKYAPGHYTGIERSRAQGPTDKPHNKQESSLKKPPKAKPYYDREWLYNAYHGRLMSVTEIAEECGVAHSSIQKALVKHKIPRRTHSKSLILRGSVAGPNNPAWNGGVADWEYNPGWKRVARTIRKRDNYTCQLCDTKFPKSSKLLHVHHIDSDKTNDSPTNLICLCSKCHHPLTGKAAEAAADELRQLVLDRNPNLTGASDN